MKMHIVHLKFDALKTDGYPVGREGGGQENDPSKMLQHTRYIIKYGLTDVNNPEHREAMSVNDGRGSALTFKVGEKCWSGQLYYYKLEDQAEKPQKTPEKVAEFWKKYNVQRGIFQPAMVTELTHGYCYIVRMAGSPIPDHQWTFTIVDETQIEKTIYDKWGYPAVITLKRNNLPVDLLTYDKLKQESIEIQSTDFLFISYRRLPKHLYGISFLRHVWDDLIEYERIDYGMSIISIQFGVVPYLIVPEDADNTEIDNVLKEFEDHRFGTSLLCLEGKKEEIEFGFASAQNAMVDFNKVLDEKLIDICTGSGYPKRWFEGSEEGALSAASEDGLAALQRLQEMFQPWVDYIKEFNIKFVGVDPEEMKLEIGMRLKYRTSDVDRANIENTETNTLITKSAVVPLNKIYKDLMPGESLPQRWKEYGDLPIPLALKALEMDIAKEYNMPLLGNPNNPNNPNNPQNKENDKQLQKAQEKLDSISDYQLMRDYHKKNATIKVFRQMFADVIGMISKEQALELVAAPALKTDSVVDCGDYYQIEGPLMIPDESLLYPETNTIEVNPLEEVKAMVERQKGQIFDLGVTDVLNQHDLESPEKRPLGRFKLMGLDPENRPYMVGVIPKSLAQKYEWLEPKLQKKEPIMISCAYKSDDVPSKREGVTYDHTNLLLYNAVACQDKGRAGEGASI